MGVINNKTMNILDLLVGRKVKYMTDAKVEVELEIASIEEEHHSQDIGPSTPANDWWPEQRQWTTIEVKFTTGFSKSYNNLSSINFLP
jgi:hypothetical protein